jgi:broad specificity phosphatase PhoE
MPTTITVIRHAPTAFNKNGTFMGVLDIPLSDDTNIKTDALKQVFEGNNCSICYTSPLKRALDTARLLFNEDVIVVDKRLIERDLGDWAGMSKIEIRTEYPTAFNESGTMDFYYTPRNGEDYASMIRRISDFLLDLCKQNANLAIVSHNGVFRVMKSLILGQKLSEVFSKFEPHLESQTFILDERVEQQLMKNCLYTVDK